MYVEEPKYYWKLKGEKHESDCNYFNYDAKNRLWSIYDKNNTEIYTTKFTENKFKQYCKENGIMFEVFERDGI